jgi:hypothetical protein
VRRVYGLLCEEHNATAAADAALEHVPVDIPAVADGEPASDASTDLFADGSETEADLI